jgi:hypothetical protein
LLLQSKAFWKAVQTLQKLIGVMLQNGQGFKPRPNLLHPYPLISTTVHQLLSVQEILDCFCEAKHSGKPFQTLRKIFGVCLLHKKIGIISSNSSNAMNAKNKKGLMGSAFAALLPFFSGQFLFFDTLSKSF